MLYVCYSVTLCSVCTVCLYVSYTNTKTHTQHTIQHHHQNQHHFTRLVSLLYTEANRAQIRFTLTLRSDVCLAAAIATATIVHIHARILTSNRLLNTQAPLVDARCLCVRRVEPRHQSFKDDLFRGPAHTNCDCGGDGAAQRDGASKHKIKQEHASGKQTFARNIKLFFNFVHVHAWYVTIYLSE